MQVGGTFDHLIEDLTPRVTAAVLSNPELLIQEGLKRGLQMLGISGGNTPTTNNPSGSRPAPAPSSPVDDLKNDGGAVMDVLGGFLK